MAMNIAGTKVRKRKPSPQAIAIAERVDRKDVPAELVQSDIIDAWAQSTMGTPLSDRLQKTVAKTFSHQVPPQLEELDINWKLLYPIGEMYNITQEALEKRGYTREETIPVYHPFVPSAGIPKSWAKGDKVRIRLNPATSWTTSIREAAQYAAFLASPASPGFVLKTYIPMSSILSTYLTGMGTKGTHEVVLAGGEYMAEAILRYD